MEQIKIENLSFSYPLCDKKAIDSFSLEIKSGEFILLCGRSGCGENDRFVCHRNQHDCGAAVRLPDFVL